jgi:UDP-N-acetylmuramoyl-tripeptide--D-alanyl-D-alanine ligase
VARLWLEAALFSFDDVSAALGAELMGVRLGAAASFTGDTNDSRVARPDEIFVALKTEARDGHDYIAEAVAKGVAAILVQQDDVAVPESVTIFRVRDTRHALGELARWWRSRFFVKATVIAGNVGKTTTKELTAALLGRCYRVLRSPSNFNDEIGLAMTLFGLDETYDCAVLEVGMDHLGEIARSCEIVRPDTAVVLNVGPTHLERLGSMEAIARAKGEAVEAIGPGGTAILNADDPYVAAMASKTKGRVLTFGVEKPADVRATAIQGRGLDGVDFTVSAFGRLLAAHSPVPGERLVPNALAAIAVAVNDAISVEDAVAGLAQLTIPTRLQPRPGSGGATILDDSYNAGPASMLAALAVLAEMPGRRIALLGDMLELGSAEIESHRLVGERAAAVAELLFTVGPRGEQIAFAAKAAGARHVVHLPSKEEAAHKLRALLGPGDVLLIKASHGIALHTVVDELVAK